MPIKRLALLFALIATAAYAAPPSIPSFKTPQANVDTLVNQAGSGSPAFTNGLSAATAKFNVDSNGNLTKINNVTTSFPSAQGTNKPLVNDGSGVLTWSTLGLAGGGTNATTKSGAFDSLSPMTTAGDSIYGGASGTGTRLAAGSATQLLHSGTTPSWSAVSLTADTTGTLPLGSGGTNATTKAGAFDSLSPMTTAGDIIYGGTSGTGTRLAAGSSTQVLHSGTTPSFSAVSLTADVSGTLPTGSGGTNKATWTAASIPYLSSTTAFNEDNANFVWDGTNHRLGIGTSSPGKQLESVMGSADVFWRMTDTSIAHGITTITPTTTFGEFLETGSNGGAQLRGFAQSTTQALHLRGVNVTASTSTPVIQMQVGKKSGTTAGNIAGTDLGFSLRNNDGSALLGVTGNAGVGINTDTPTSSIIGGTHSQLDISGPSNAPLVTMHGALNGGSVAEEFSILRATNGTFIDSAGSTTATNNKVTFRTSNTTNDFSTLITALQLNSNGSIGVTTTNWLTGGTAVGVSGGLFTLTPSSIRYKENIVPLDKEVDTSHVYELKPVAFDYKKGGAHSFGYIAEDVAKVAPELVNYEKDENGSLRPESVSYDHVSVLLLEEIKKLKARIEVLEAKK